MLTIVYRSEASHTLAPSDLAALCLACARKNQALGVTGFLLHLDGLFLQVLEGERSVLEPLFNTIRHDDRHRKVEVLLYEDSVTKPNFAFWSMNLGPLDDEAFRARVMRGVNTRDEFLARTHDPDFALDVLTRAYMEACVMSDVDPAAHDLTTGTIPAWILPTYMAQQPAA
ncbi:BLUF domain-containing protein [Azospirillum sp. sgz302134]